GERLRSRQPDRRLFAVRRPDVHYEPQTSPQPGAQRGALRAIGGVGQGVFGREPMTARTLGLDVGRRRIGVAVSDELGLTAQALTVIDNTGGDDVLAAIQALVREYNVGLVVIG